MVLVADNDVADKLLSVDCIVRPMPSGHLVEDVESDGITDIKELRVGRIMGQTHSIHIHRAYELCILKVLGVRECAACLRTERVTVYSLEHDLLPVDIHTVILPHLNGTESELLTLSMESLAAAIGKREYCLITCGSL